MSRRRLAPVLGAALALVAPAVAQTGTDEPVLLARALYPATEYQPGPTSGTVGVNPADGITPPFDGQPIPGISGAVWNDDGTLWGQPDNGFGSKENSADFLLRIYRFAPEWRTRKGGSGELRVKGFVSLRDPDGKVPWPIVNEDTDDRLLTGADFDIESIQRAPDGAFWIGEELGPFVLHVDATGKLLDEPVGLPGVTSPQNPTLGTGETANLPGSRGFEAMAMSEDGTRLYPILEGALTTDTGEHAAIRRVYEFDTGTDEYTDATWTFRATADTTLIGDAQVIGGRRLLLIERDASRALRPSRSSSPRSISTPSRRRAARCRRAPSSTSCTSPTRSASRRPMLIANDNNLPGSNGRTPGTPDDLEAAVVKVPGLR